MDFEKLYKTDITKHIEKKGKFSYLSWPYAVAEFRKACPDGVWKIESFGENKQPYCQSDAGCFVEISVWPDTEKEVCFTQIHPVLDYKNKTVKEPDAFQINTSIQRCLVKAIALATGIGLHIYAGEDLPVEPSEYEKKVDKDTKSGEVVSDYVDSMEKNTTVEAHIKWKRTNKDEIGKLTAEERTKINRHYEQWMKQLREIEEKEKNG